MAFPINNIYKIFSKFMLCTGVKRCFWFFNKDKTLIEIMPGLLPCVACAKHKAPAGTAYALEINTGMADKFDIKTGDRLVYTDK